MHPVKTRVMARRRETREMHLFIFKLLDGPIHHIVYLLSKKCTLLPFAFVIRYTPVEGVHT